MADEVEWQALAQRYGGELSPKADWRSPSLRVPHRGFTMHADIRLVQRGHAGDGAGYENQRLGWTAMVRAPYRSADGFRFSTRRRDLFERRVEPLRIFRPRIEDPRLRAARTFSTNDKTKLSSLLSTPANAYREAGSGEALRTRLSDMTEAVLEVRSPEHWTTAERQTFPENVRELSAHQPNDGASDTITKLIELCRTALSQLERIGSAAPL
ncbi:MAG: hypothetical protein AB8I08_19380 [Sandaracinaceae bacterium]